jgi:hypothetical protein
MTVRSPRRFLVVASVLVAALVFVVAAPASGQSSGVCSLVTRREAGKLLRAKVVKTEKDESPANGAQQCTYTTKKVVKELEDRGLKLKLEVTVQPITDDLRSKLQNIPFDDGSRIEGLGDEAYVTQFEQVIAVSGDIVLAAKPQNYSGASTKIRGISVGAVRAALPRLDQVTVNPPAGSSS